MYALLTTAVPSRITKTAASIIAIAIIVTLMAMSARITILTPLSPVPITLQVLVVIASGLMLGAQRAAIAQVAYLSLIAAGLPLMTASGLSGIGVFAGPTAGYLLAFAPSAFLVGICRGKSDNYLHNFLACIAGVAVIYLGGTAWLTAYLGGSLTRALSLGVVPFIAGDLVKIIFAVVIAGGYRRE